MTCLNTSNFSFVEQNCLTFQLTGTSASWLRRLQPPLLQPLGDMGNLWTLFVEAVSKDDLVIRVTLGVFGVGAFALGLFMVCEPAYSNEPLGWLLVLLVMGLLFMLWGFVVFVAAFTAPSSRWSDFAEKCYPNPAGLDDAAIFILIILFPAVLLTLLLRALGVRGYVT
jgi:hypothetical protein